MIKEKNKNFKNIINIESILSNCNCTLRAVDYNKNLNILAYCSSNIVHIYDFILEKTVFTLKSNKERINSVRFIENEDINYLITINSEGICNVWSIKNDKSENFYLNYDNWSIVKSINSDDNESINCFDVVLDIDTNNLYISFYTENQYLYLYLITSNGLIYKLLKLKQKSIIQDICLCFLTNNNIMLSTGGYDKLINIYVYNKNNYNYEKTIDNLKPNAVLKGHTNTIQGLSVDKKLLPKYMASCSQDTYVRLWSLKVLSKEDINIYKSSKRENITVFDEYKSQTSYVFNVDNIDYYHILLETILSDHEDSVSSVQIINNEKTNEIKLLTSSLDFTVGIWHYKNDLWQKQYTLGEMHGNKHSFFCALSLNLDNKIVAYNFTGALYFWDFDANNNTYKSSIISRGHYNIVTDVVWEPIYGRYLLSCSKDQTTRAYSLYKNKSKNTSSWYEIGRPQIHGYDINSIALINNSDLNDNKSKSLVCKLISASEEKIIRMFDPPYNIVKYLNTFNQLNNLSQNKTEDVFVMSYTKSNSEYEKNIVEGSKQMLGLMNKTSVINQISTNKEETADERFDATNFDPTAMLTNKIDNSINYNNELFTKPPDEDFCTNHTLWPELNKLYGHSYEVYSIAASNKGDLFASANISKNDRYSQLYIWDPNKNTVLQKLEGHNLTIAQIRFSKDDSLILTVSRDQSWCLFKRKSNDSKSYYLLQRNSNCHSRIIWSGDISSDNSLIITGSRDKTLQVWGLNLNKEKEQYTYLNKIILNEAITAVEFLPYNKSKEIKFALVGLESGELILYKFILDFNNSNVLSAKWELIESLPNKISCGAKIKKISSVFNIKSNNILSAVCSDDYSVRIFSIILENLNNIDS